LHSTTPLPLSLCLPVADLPPSIPPSPLQALHRTSGAPVHRSRYANQYRLQKSRPAHARQLCRGAGTRVRKEKRLVFLAEVHAADASHCEAVGQVHCRGQRQGGAIHHAVWSCCCRCRHWSCCCRCRCRHWSCYKCWCSSNGQKGQGAVRSGGSDHDGSVASRGCCVSQAAKEPVAHTPQQDWRRGQRERG